MLTRPLLPVIALGGLRSADRDVRGETARTLRAACIDHGFFYLTDHGIPADELREMLDAARTFFALPAEEKLRLDYRLSAANRGYEPIGAQTLQAGTAPDLKEGFYIGVDLPSDDRRVVANVFNHGPNQWPPLPDAWKRSIVRYFDAMLELGESLMRGIALSLRLPEAHFASYCRDPMALLRLLHYPPQAANPHPGEKGCGEHTDWGAVTFLLQDDVGGLQVFDNMRGWCDVTPMPGAFVVNLGDLLARWTNDLYRSTLHRVVNLSGRERYSIPFFFDGNPDYPIACLPTCLPAGGIATYAPTTQVEHLEEMYRRTYGS